MTINFFEIHAFAESLLTKDDSRSGCKTYAIEWDANALTKQIVTRTGRNSMLFRADLKV